MGDGGDGELSFNGYRVSVWNHGKVLEMDISNDFTLGMYLVPLNHTLKTVKMVNFISCIFCHSERKCKMFSAPLSIL